MKFKYSRILSSTLFGISLALMGCGNLNFSAQTTSSSSNGGSSQDENGQGNDSPLNSGAGSGLGEHSEDQDRDWLAKGYELYWVGTPSQEDVGKNVENYFRTKWNGGFPLRAYSEDTASGTVSIALAPDGSPSLKAVINSGDNDNILAVYGHQFGPIGPEKQLVATMEWYNPCDGGQRSNGRAGTYVGFGHVWGSADNVNTVPGGSNNSDEAWSYRLALSTSNFFAGYAYITDATKSAYAT